jgi:hypothetical protein
MLKECIELLGISKPYPEATGICETQKPAPERRMKVEYKIIRTNFESAPQPQKS